MKTITNQIYGINGGGSGSGSGITGPASSTDNAVVRWDGTTGTAIKNSNATLSAAGTLTLAGNLNLPTTSSIAGAITQNATRILHTYGTDNLFAGNSAGNFTLSGNSNVGVGESALANLTSGSGNIAIGQDAGNATTSGSNNIYIGNIGNATEENIIRIGTIGTHETIYAAGIATTFLSGALPVVVGLDGELGYSVAPTRTHSVNGMALLTGAGQTLLGGVQLTASNVGIVPVVEPIVFNSFRFRLSRSLVGGESISIKLIRSAGPDVVLSQGSWGATLNSSTPTASDADAFSVSVAAGASWYIFVNVWTPSGGDLYFSYTLEGYWD